MRFALLAFALLAACSLPAVAAVEKQFVPLPKVDAVSLSQNNVFLSLEDYEAAQAESSIQKESSTFHQTRCQLSGRYRICF